MKILFTLILMIMLSPSYCTCDEYSDYISYGLESEEINDIERSLPENDYTKGYSFSKTASDFIGGKLEITPDKILSEALNVVFGGFSKNAKMFTDFLAAILLCALIENVSKAFGNSYDSVGFFVCFLTVAAAGLNYFFEISDEAVVIIENLIVVIGSLAPVLLGFVAGMGNTATATALHPVFFISSSIISTVIKSIIIPCLFLVLALKITDGVSAGASLKRLFTMLSNIIKWMTGILMTVFIAIVGIFSTAGPAMDSIGIKTAKYAVGNFVPVVGGMLSDSLELVFTCSSVLKSGVGAAGLGAIIVTAVFPCVEILAKIIIFNVAAALAEPVCNERITKVIGDISSSLTLLFSMVVFIVMMYFVSIASVISIKGG